MDYKKKYERANAVLVKIQEMIDNNNLDAVDFCENVNCLLREYNNKKITIMKELSIEEKARRYDEAIEKANELLEIGLKDTRDKRVVLSFFPELAESEDEKIRKDIVAAVETYGDFTQGRKEEIYAWLEKQGEQKLYVNDNAKEMFIKALERVEEQNAKGYKLTDCDKNSWWEDFKAYTSCIIEQKPAWSEEDINMIDWLIRCCEKEHKELCNDKYGHQDIVSDLKRDCRKKWDWLESLKNRVAPQKQWKPSDEQMLALKHASNDCSIAFADMKILATLYEQLKALHRYEQDT